MAAVGSNGEVDETAIAKALAMDYPDDELMWNLPSMIEGDPQPTWPGIDKSKNNATKFSGIPIGFRSYSFNPADGGVQWDHASYSAGWWSSTQGVMGEGYCAVVRMWSDNQRFATDSNFIGGVGRIDLTLYFFSGSAYAGPLFLCVSAGRKIARRMSECRRCGAMTRWRWGVAHCLGCSGVCELFSA